MVAILEELNQEQVKEEPKQEESLIKRPARRKKAWRSKYMKDEWKKKKAKANKVKQTKMGAPTRFKDDMVKQVEVLGMLGLELKEVAQVFGVTPATISRYNNIHPEFNEAYLKGKTTAKFRSRKVLMDMALSGNNFQALKEFMDRIDKDWKPSDGLQIGQGTPVTIEINLTQGKDEAEAVKIIETEATPEIEVETEEIENGNE